LADDKSQLTRLAASLYHRYVTVLSAVKTRSIRSVVDEEIRNALRAGLFQPGEDLNEVTLASQLRVSRGPLREALVSLTQEGLLSYSQNKGFSVPTFTQEDRRNIDEVRMLLEARTLELARKAATPEQIGFLEERMEEVLESFSRGEPLARERAEMAFHGAIWDLCGNPWLVKSLRRVMLPYFTYCLNLAPPPDVPTVEEMRERHRVYLDYLATQTDRTAEECVRIHLGQAPAQAD
jgi:DNA-binding GntR family transcriptional regulator